jgi:glycosyltransferase involved in cell wall biosynthesis
MPTISYAITACNEHVELDRLLEILTESIRPEDEIVIQLDKTATAEVRSVCFDFGRPNLRVIEFPLNNDFGTFKNNLSKECLKDYIFQIDADEYPHPYLIESLPKIFSYNQNVEVLLVPRINTVTGLTNEHIKQWGWNVNDKGWVNFPDYQWRVWKNKVGVHWINKVHERLEGFKEFSALPQMEEYCLFHPKDIARQERQNQFYNTI